LSNIELFKRINLKQVADLFVECTAWSKELFTKLEEKQMRLRITSTLAVVAMLLVAVTACSAVARHHEQLASHLVAVADTDDPISGEWNVSFFVHDQTTPATFNLKLEGNKITGTAFSEHTGPGTIRDGSWDKGSSTSLSISKTTNPSLSREVFKRRNSLASSPLKASLPTGKHSESKPGGPITE